MTLDILIAQTLAQYEQWLLSSGWHGKETDCVNLFAHGFLFQHIRSGAAIEDFTQVGIEVGVPQPDGIGIKPAARKDLVIWDSARAVTWDEHWQAVRHPLAIIEWKARRKPLLPVLYPADIEWLRRYSLHYPDFTGYAVTVDFTSFQRRIATARVFGGQIVEDFHKPSAQISSLLVA